MVGDACKDIAQIGLWIAPVHPCRLDERVECCGPDATGVGTCKHVILSSQNQRLDRALDRVVGHFEAAVGRIARQRVPARQGITDCLGQSTLAADLAQRPFQEDLQLVEQRNGVLLTGGEALRRRAAVDPRLDGKQFCDALQRLLSQGRGGFLINLVDFAACMTLMSSST
jgi:hypothetical protein